MSPEKVREAFRSQGLDWEEARRLMKLRSGESTHITLEIDGKPVNVKVTAQNMPDPEDLAALKRMQDRLAATTICLLCGALGVVWLMLLSRVL